MLTMTLDELNFFRETYKKYVRSATNKYAFAFGMELLTQVEYKIFQLTNHWDEDFQGTPPDNH